jgi:hypothetical protein
MLRAGPKVTTPSVIVRDALWHCGCLGMDFLFQLLPNVRTTGKQIGDNLEP